MAIQLPTELAKLWPQWQADVQQRLASDTKLKMLADRHSVVVVHSRDLYAGGDVYFRSGYSFIHESVEPRFDGNDVQILFHDRQAKWFEFNVLPHQKNAVVDLGPVDFQQDPDPSKITIDHPGGPTTCAEAVEGNVYLELVRDGWGNNFYVLFQVVAVDPESRYAAFIWRKLPGGRVVK